MESILLVEDNTGMREMLSTILGEAGYDVHSAADTAKAMDLLQQRNFSAIVSDLQLPDMDGLSFFHKVQPLRIPFIIITAFGSIEKAVEAIRAGAFDFIAKPVDPDYLLLMLEKALASTRIFRENIILREAIQARTENQPIIGKSRQIMDVGEKVRQVAASDMPVLLQGESGSGKELFARAIHRLSPRQQQPFVAINSASIPENLLENELFGHEKGSYTGAHVRQFGKLELAQGGTFFFDEISDLPRALQGKLLRVLEEKKICRIGGAQAIHLDIRFIFATNQNLEAAVGQDTFRRDLYFRIAAFPIAIPPLRERREDIGLLADFFVQKYARELKKNITALSVAARQKLHGYDWPGNIRELQNTMERAVIINRSEQIAADEIILPEKPFPLTETLHFGGTLKDVSQRAIRLVEKMKVEMVLAECGGNKSRAAKKLAVSYKTLLEKIRAFGIKAEKPPGQ